MARKKPILEYTVVKQEIKQMLLQCLPLLLLQEEIDCLDSVPVLSSANRKHRWAARVQKPGVRLGRVQNRSGQPSRMTSLLSEFPREERRKYLAARQCHTAIPSHCQSANPTRQRHSVDLAGILHERQASLPLALDHGSCDP